MNIVGVIDRSGCGVSGRTTNAAVRAPNRVVVDDDDAIRSHDPMETDRAGTTHRDGCYGGKRRRSPRPSSLASVVVTAAVTMMILALSSSRPPPMIRGFSPPSSSSSSHRRHRGVATMIPPPPGGKAVAAAGKLRSNRAARGLLDARSSSSPRTTTKTALGLSSSRGRCGVASGGSNETATTEPPPRASSSSSSSDAFLREAFDTTAPPAWVSPDNLPPTVAAATTTTTVGDRREVRIHRLPGVKRVHGISDLHVDHRENWDWLVSACLPQPAGTGAGWDASDLIVVAGDISHETEKIEASLRLLAGTGASVVFVPGNHEAWLERAPPPPPKDADADEEEEEGGTAAAAVASDSVEKLERIEALCRRMGVYTTGDCVRVGGGGDDSGDDDEELWILPLDSWYDGSLSFVPLNDDDPDVNDHLVRDFAKWPWVDFLRCRWPERLYETENATETERSRLLRRIPAGLVGYFLDRNRPTIDVFHEAVRESSGNGNSKAKKVSVMTVTHFLPNQQSLPDWKDLSVPEFRLDEWLDHGAGGLSAKFALVGGSVGIDDQIRSLAVEPTAPNGGFRRRIHVFGHSHRPKSFSHDGIRYVHHPLGKPSERDMRMVDPAVAIKPLWEATSSADPGCGDDDGDDDDETILRYWEEHGGGLEMLFRRMEGNKRNRKRRSRKHHDGGGGRVVPPKPS